jgi:hypothetical protein
MEVEGKITAVMTFSVTPTALANALHQHIETLLEYPTNTVSYENNYFYTDAEGRTYEGSSERGSSLESNDPNIAILVDAYNILVQGIPQKTPIELNGMRRNNYPYGDDPKPRIEGELIDLTSARPKKA